MPIKILVKKFKPIWKLKFAPTKLIIQISKPPKKELNTNFKIFLIGTIKILPKINKKHIQAKYVITFISIKKSIPFLKAYIWFEKELDKFLGKQARKLEAYYCTLIAFVAQFNAEICQLFFKPKLTPNNNF